MRLLPTDTRSVFTLGVLLVVFLTLASGAEAQSGNPVLDAPGLQANHHYSSALPFEHIDTATGSLVLTHTDLALPGNGGRDLKFQRAWNNKTQRWSYGIADIPLALTYTWPAVAPLSEDPDPTYVMADGSSHAMAFQLDPSPTVNGRRYMIDDRFWLFDRASGVLWMSDGWSAIYSSDGHLATVYDPFGNIVLTATWDTDGIGTDGIVFTHYVSLTEYREITWTWSGCDGFTCQERTMTYAGRVWTYSQPTPTSPTTVTLPEGLTWTYEDTTALLKVTTPYGGRVDYAFEDVEFPDFPELGQTTFTEVTKTRKTYRVDGALEGTTSYAYSFDTPEYSTSTVVTSPDGTITTFEHEYLGTVEEAYRGQTFIVTGRVIEKDGVTLEQETREYADVPAQTGTMPALFRSTVTRGSATYSTTYCYAASNYGDYRRPYKIIEDGDLDRTIVRVYAHTWNAPTTRNVLGMVTSKRVTNVAAAGCEADPVGGRTVETTRSYDTATEFVTVETAGGIATTFTRDDFGNVRRITKANGTWMEHAYTNGAVSNVTTSESGYEISRVINPDGTVASETQAGRTTSYGYDDLGRVELIDLPLGNNTTSTYSANSITTTRGTSPVVSSVTTTVDGFGRPIGTLDAAQVRTRTMYDAMGRVAYQSLPYDTGQADLGIVFTYDGLGRVIREEHADGTFRTFAYDGNVATATDENGHVTVLTHKSYNASEGGLLASLVDPAGMAWNYTYDVLGQMTSLAGPDGVTRAWTYDTSVPTLLRSESHPESGTVSFPDYDAAGLLEAHTDANGNAFQYQYDGNDRLTQVTAGTSVTTITYEPGSDNRQTTVIDGVSSEFVYDAAGRLQRRTDTVDGKPFVTEFSYDPNDNLAAIAYPSGRTVAYEYGAENRLTRVFNPATNTNYASGFTYHPSGAPASYTTGNGIVTTLTYHPTRYWITGITAGEMALGYTSYDAVGNVQTIADSHFGTQTFTYDVVDRLQSATGAYGLIPYSYDAHGNQQGANFGYSPANRFRLESYAGMPMTYDANGNMKTRSGDAFDYTPDNLVKTATVGGTATSYAYDADAWRVKKAVGGGETTYYVRGPSGQLLMEWVNSSPTATVREYIYAGSRLIAVMKGEVPPK